MGAVVCAAVAAADDLDLVAAVDPARAGTSVRAVSGAEVDLMVGADRESLVRAGTEAVVDFTQPDAARDNLRWCASRQLHMVVGTTGLGPADLDEARSLYPPDGRLGCVLAPNFAVGAVLMMRFAELAAPWFDTAEIVELHHDAKRDAPSGTAVLTAERMASASADWADDPTVEQVVPGARGGVTPGGIHVHSLRLRGMVAHQEVILGTAGQTLTIRHDSYDRTSFMPGVLIALRCVASRPGLTVGLDQLLGF
jgi:4-hydroxy-tetrahydrodipicolinate reductase